MIPTKENTAAAAASPEEKMGSFSFFDLGHFLQRLKRNWFWFVIMFALGYGLSWFYARYYAQRIYASDLTLSISDKTAAYFTPQQSINFIWGQGGNADGIFLKKMMLSRSHNEFLVKEQKLYVDYQTKGKIRSTHLDKYDSPVLFEVDETHLQQVDYPITIVRRSATRYEVSFPENISTSLYDYRGEFFANVAPYPKPQNKVISIGEWYTSPNLRFRLLPNTMPSDLEVPNVIVTLSTVNNAVTNIVSNLDIGFDKEIPTIMQVTKRGYNLNETVNFLNTSVAFLQKKRLQDQTMVDKNTQAYLDDNLKAMRRKLDSAASVMNQLKVQEGLYDIKDLDKRSLDQIKELESKKADLLVKMNSLGNIQGSLSSRNLNGMISSDAAGFADPQFSTAVSDLKSLYMKRQEMAQIYTPNSEPMREINRLIAEAKRTGDTSLRRYRSTYQDQISRINAEISSLESRLTGFPEQERKYLDAQRGYDMIEAAYNTLSTKQNETQIRIASNQSDITVIDPAKNVGQGPIAPNISRIKTTIISTLLLLPLVLLALRELLDTKIRNLKEVLRVTRLPLLGVIGRNLSGDNLVVLQQPKSSVAEAFRSLRSNLRFISKEDGTHKVILVTSSVGGEGKTFVSINLASVLALSGKRTVLVGMDLRKPKIFGDFEIENKFGVSNFLSGQATLEQIINRTMIDSLDVIPAGPIPPNPSELLMSEQNTQLVETLKQKYDFVVIDSPPVGLVADSLELMGHSDATIYVVRNEYTEKYMLRMITEKYHNKEVNNLALVYNDANFKNGYGYSYGYGYGYGYGYFDEDANYELPWIIRAKNGLKNMFSKN